MHFGISALIIFPITLSMQAEPTTSVWDDMGILFAKTTKECCDAPGKFKK